MFYMLNSFIFNLFNILNIYHKTNTRHKVAEVCSVTSTRLFLKWKQLLFRVVISILENTTISCSVIPNY